MRKFQFRFAGVQKVKKIKLDLQGNFTLQMRILSENFREEIRRQIRKKEKEIIQLRTRAEVERRKLVERQRDKQVYDKLEEREMDLYEEEYKREQTKDMDEVASILYQYDNFGQSTSGSHESESGESS